MFLAQFMVISFIAWFLSNWAELVLPFVPGANRVQAPRVIVGRSLCVCGLVRYRAVLKAVPSELFGTAAVYRVMLALVLYHLLFSLLMLGVKTR